MRLVLYLALPLVLLVTAAACRQDETSLPGKGAAPLVTPTQPPTAVLTQVDQGQGGVTVEATWVTEAYLRQMDRASRDALREFTADRFVLVQLKLDTHSVDLARYDLTRLATLGGPNGSSVEAVAWLDIEESGHHREGVLVFPGRSNEQWMAEQEKAELTLKGIAGVAQRVFRWEF